MTLFQKNQCTCTLCFPSSWIKEGLKTEIRGKIRKNGTSQNAVQADKFIRFLVLKDVCKVRP